MKKIDFYRIYRVLNAIRKSSYFSGLDSVDKLRYNNLLIESLKDLYRLENFSNSSFQVFIFLTASFISIIQIILSLDNIDTKSYTIVIVITYILIVLLAQLIFAVKRRLLNRSIYQKQINYNKTLEDKEKEIKKAEIQDDMFSKLTELKLLDELSMEIFEDKTKDESLKRKEIDAIINSAELITKEINKKKQQLHDID